MKVLCIRKEPWNATDGAAQKIMPKYLEVCEVVSCEECAADDVPGYKILPGTYYILAGYEPQFHSSSFITLPDATADEMQEEEHESIIM